MKKENKNIVSTVFPPCLQFVMIASLFVILVTLGIGSLFCTTQTTMGKIIFWNVEYFFVFALCAELLGWAKPFKFRQNLVIGGLYAVSFCMVWNTLNYDMLNFWMIGVLLLAYFIPTEMALAMHIILTISYCLVNERPVEVFIGYFTLGTLILLLTEFLDKLINTIIIACIAVIANMAFLILINDFAMKFSEEQLLELASTFLLVFSLYGTGIYMNWEKKTVLDLDLMNQLKESSPAIYEHCMLVGNISKNAAKVIGADEDLAYAAGCYHEVGRIEGKDYVVNGEKILSEKGVSQKVIDVMKEHNMNYGKPSSKEAAIIMLTDSIATIIQYYHLKQPDKQVNLEKLVTSTIGKRTEQGLLKDSSLTQEELAQLKDCYIQHFQGK